MRGRSLLVVALSCAVFALPGRADKRIAIQPPLGQPEDQPKPAKVASVAADPAEPPLHVDLDLPHRPRVGNKSDSTKAEVVSGARGTVVKVPSQGAYQGAATLTFKNAAPPMRFTTQLTSMQHQDLSSLSLTSGTLTLQVGSVGTSETTKYFDAKGLEQAVPARAAYTLRARRTEHGTVEVELRRGAGAALGKTMTLSWQSNLNNIKLRGLGRR